MRLRYLLVVAGVLTLASQGLAQGCEGWNTSLFFLSATPAEVESCLAARADVNARSAGLGYTPLHWAVRFSEDPAVITALLDAGADATARDNDGNTPWDYVKDREELQGSDVHRRLNEAQTLAAECGGWNTAKFFESASLEMVTDCLDAGAEVSARNEVGHTPLHLAACCTANPAIISTLLGARAEVNARSARGDTPLHFAAAHSTPAVVAALVDAGAEVNARNEDSITPLHLAASYNANPAIIRALVEAGAEVNARDEYDYTPLHLAIRWSDDPAVITALLEAGAEVNARLEDGQTPLHLAITDSDNPAVIRALVEAGAEANARDEEGHTPLHLAVRDSGNPTTIITVLLNAGADPAARDAYGKIPRDYFEDNYVLKGICEEWGTWEFFESATLEWVVSCLAVGAEVNAQARGGTPLHSAARATDDPAIIRLLVDAGARVDAQVETRAYYSGWTPLHWAARTNDNPAVIRTLLDAGARVNSWNEFGHTPLHFAGCCTDNPTIISALLDAGAEVNARDKDGETPLHWAARTNDNPAVITALLDAGADAVARGDEGKTPWDYARGRPELEGSDAYRWLAAQVLAADCAEWGTTAREYFWEFFKSATLERVVGCLAAGAEVNARSVVLDNTPLHWAANHTNDPDIIGALLDAGAEVNARNELGWTPLHWANTANPNIISALLDAGADVGARDDFGATPLHWAAQVSDNPATITLLLEAGADASTRNDDGLTPWDLAQENEALRGTDVWWRLAAHAATTDCADWNTPDFFGSANAAVVRSCLAAGADVNARGRLGGRLGGTPLHLAAFSSDDPAIIQALVTGGARVNARDEDGQAPLHIAAAYNDAPAVIRALVSAGAWLEARMTEFGTTPLHIAAGYNDAPAVITALLDAGADGAAQTNWGATPWDLAQDNEALRGTDAWWRLAAARFQ